MKVKRCFFIAVFSVLFFSFSSNREIEWQENRKLSWNDFRGTPDYTTDAAAITASGIAYSLSAAVKSSGEVTAKFRINTFFYPEDSWYKKELANEIVLAHEQLHFDITELFARKFRKTLSEYKFSKKIKQEVRAIYAQMTEDLQAFQKKYDYATDYSRIFENQKKWQLIVEKELQKYEAFKED